MQRRWSGRNVDLGKFSSCLCEFFSERDFNVRKEDVSGGFRIFAEGSSVFELDGYVSVDVEGCPSDFVVALNFYRKGRRRGFPTGPLTMALFGGGWLFLQHLKREENWVKLEKEFWRYVENVLLRLSNSA